MKRSTKVFVSSLISFCMIVLNLPMTALSIRADGDDPEPETHQYIVEDIDDGQGRTALRLQDVTESEHPVDLASQDYILPGTFTINCNGTNSIVKTEINYNNSVIKSVEKTGNDPATDTWELTHYAKIIDIRIMGENDTVELVVQDAYFIHADSTIDVQVDVSGEFQGALNMSNAGTEQQPRYEGEISVDSAPAGVAVDTMDYQFNSISINGVDQTLQSVIAGRNYFSFENNQPANGIYYIEIDGEPITTWDIR